MKTRLRSYLYLALRAVHRIRRRPVVALLTAGVFAAAIVLLGLARLTGDNLDRLASRFGGGVQMIVYLDDGADDATAARIAASLDDLPAVEAVDHVPPERALDRVRDSLGGHDEMLGGVEVGFLPASLEVSLVDGVADLASMHPLVERLEAMPGIAAVEFPGDWVDDVTGFFEGLRAIGGFLLLLAAICGGLAVLAVQRASAGSRGREDRVLELVGATSTYRRLPAVIEGAALGTAGALAACVALYIVFETVTPGIEATLALAAADIDLGFLPLRELAALAFLGTALGAAGGLLARSPDAA